MQELGVHVIQQPWKVLPHRRVEVTQDSGQQGGCRRFAIATPRRRCQHAPPLELLGRSLIIVFEGLKTDTLQEIGGPIGLFLVSAQRADEDPGPAAGGWLGSRLVQLDPSHGLPVLVEKLQSPDAPFLVRDDHQGTDAGNGRDHLTDRKLGQ